MTAVARLERILAMARKRGFEDGHAGKESLETRSASRRELVAGLAAAAGGGLLKVGETERWADQVTIAYRAAYRSGAAERPKVRT